MRRTRAWALLVLLGITMVVIVVLPLSGDPTKPFRGNELRFRAPNWSALAVWDRVCEGYLGLDSDPRDRAGRRMIHP